MISALWIVGVDHVPLQKLNFVPLQQSDQVARKRVGITLSEWPQWFKDNLSDADVDLPISGRIVAAGYKIYGVAKISARGALLHSGESLFKPSREGKLLMDMFHQPADAALFKIVDAASLMQPIEITRRRTASVRQRLCFLFSSSV